MERLNLKCDRSVAHATRRSEGSQGCREDADDELNDGLPSFLFHSIRFLRLNYVFDLLSSRRRVTPPLFSADLQFSARLCRFYKGDSRLKEFSIFNFQSSIFNFQFSIFHFPFSID